MATHRMNDADDATGERFKSLSLGPNIRKSLQTGEMDIEELPQADPHNELPSEAMRFDLLKQLADIQALRIPSRRSSKKARGRERSCPCGSGKKYKRCCGK